MQEEKLEKPSFSDRLKTAIEKSGVSIDSIASKLRCSPSYLRQLAAGSKRPEGQKSIEKWENILGDLEKGSILKEDAGPYRSGMQTIGMKGAAAIIEEQLAVWAASLPDLSEEDRVMALHRIIGEAYELLRRADPKVVSAVEAILKDSLGEGKKPIGFGPRSILHHCYKAGKKGLPEPVFAAHSGFQKPVKLQVSP